MDIYREKLLEHYNDPHNYGELDDADVSEELANISCGDSIKIQLKVSDNKIRDIRFSGEGCAVAIACASMLTDLAKGMDLDAVQKLTLEEFLKTIGLEFTLSRLKCANLGLETLQKCSNKLIANSVK